MGLAQALHKLLLLSELLRENLDNFALFAQVFVLRFQLALLAKHDRILAGRVAVLVETLQNNC